MNFNDAISQFASGSAIKNTVEENLSAIGTQSATLGALSSLPGLSDVKDGIDAMKASVSAKWAAMLSQLPIALPALKAVHVLEKKMEMSSGGIASAAASSSFDSYFGSMDSVKSAMASLTSSVTSAISSMGAAAGGIAGVVGSGPDALASLGAQIPPPTIPNPENPAQTITNPAYTSFMSSNSAALGSLTGTATGMGAVVGSTQAAVEGHFSGADGAYKAGIGKLRGMAFAQFCAMPQPAPVRDVIGKTVHAESIPNTEDIKQSQRTGSAWIGSQMATVTRDRPAVAAENPELAGAKPIVSPDTSVPTQATEAQLSAIRAQIGTQYSATQEASDAADAAGRDFKAWMDSVNYAAAKNNQASDPGTYNALRAQAEVQPSYQLTNQRMATYKAAVAKLQQLRGIANHMYSTGPWPGNPNGPW